MTVPPMLWGQLQAHLFPGDDDEHGAIILAGLAAGPRGPRLLARDLMLAADGVDYVPGETGYRALADDFVNRAIDRAEAERLAYVAVHCHKGLTTVAFSPLDMASHERAYPAIAQMTDRPTGGLVLARQAAAGDVFLPGGTRSTLAEVVVPTRNLLRLRPEPAAPTTGNDPGYDRQSRLFGPAGQASLGKMRVAVVGLGGIGSILVELLGRLGVGHLVLIDPDKVDPTNLHRLPAARRLDAMTWLRRDGAPAFARRLGEALSTPKTRLSARNVRRANRTVKVTRLQCDVADPRAINALTQVDWIFLAADTNTARHVTNAVIQQYLVPGIQVGVSVPVADDGQVGEVHIAIRPLLPGAACQWCQDLIDPSELALEAQPHYVRQQARYVRDLPAPSVMTLNTIAAGEASNYFMFSTVALHTDDADLDARTHFPRSRERDRQSATARPRCRWCSPAPGSALALGNSRPVLPTAGDTFPTYRG
jgi:ThiF family